MFKFRVRVVLILIFGGFLMVSTRLFYLQIVRGSYYRHYAENVRIDTRSTQASRGAIHAAGGELLAFDRPSFDVAMVPSRLPQWRRLCRPVLRLYSLGRREQIVGLRDVTVMVTNGPGGEGYEVSFGLAATFLRGSGTELVEKEEHGTARVVVPQEVAALVDRVAGQVGTSAKEMLRAFFDGLALVGRGWRRLGEPCVVAREVGFLPAAEIESNSDRYPGFRVVPTSRRSYPYDELACHVLGHMQQVSAVEYDRWCETYAGSEAKRFLPDDMIGRAGVERFFDRALRPARGVVTVEVDAARRTQRVLEEDPPVSGASLHLTIDVDVQRAVQDALDKQVGSAVLMEAATGRILAVASTPAFNPNDLPENPPDPADPLAPLLNRAVQGQYPLGSAFKLLLAAAALEEGRVFREVLCSGEYHSRGCSNHRVPMIVGLHDAIKRSCNVYFYRTAQEMLTIDRVVAWGSRFGLGEVTGVGLPGEKAGLLPTPEWKRGRFREGWYLGDTCNLAIGQGYLLVTPLQVARMVAAIANGGRLVRPRLVDRIAHADGSAETPDDGGENATLRLTPARLDELHRAMRAVCHEMGGTAWRAWSQKTPESTPWIEEQGYAVAGKTSTADAWLRGKRGNIGWFVGFAPVRDPRVVVVVALEHEDSHLHGGDVAAPLARRILERLPERYLEGVPGGDLRARHREHLVMGKGQR